MKKRKSVETSKKRGRIFSKIADVMMTTATKALIAVVCGAVVTVGTVSVAKDVVIPAMNSKVASIANMDGEYDGAAGGADGEVNGTVNAGNSTVEDDSSAVSVVHEGTIPAGGVYYTGLTDYYSYAGNYENATATYTAGDSFPATVNAGDVYVYDGLEYRYYRTTAPVGFEAGTFAWSTAGAVDGWSVMAVDSETLTSATIIPEINGVATTNMKGAFSRCSNLVSVSEIPSTVTSLEYAFYNCSLLTVVPALPSSVTDMSYTFYGCTSLVTAPEIPSSVTEMKWTFQGCTNLEGEIVINASPTTYTSCFDGTTKSIVLSGSSTRLSNLAATSTAGNVTVAES